MSAGGAEEPREPVAAAEVAEAGKAAVRIAERREPAGAGSEAGTQ
jgi:hypothetical protein